MAAYTLTSVGTLATRLMQRTGDPAKFWGLQEKVDAITEAMRLWQALTGALQTTYPAVVGLDVWVTVPRQIACVTRVTRNGVGLAQTSLKTLDLMDSGWEAKSGVPDAWAPDGVTRFALNRIPTISPSVLFSLTGIADVANLGAGDSVQVGNEELTILLGAAEHFLTFKEGGRELESSTEALKVLVAAAALRNSRLLHTDIYERFKGTDIDGRGEAGRPGVGVRPVA